MFMCPLTRQCGHIYPGTRVEPPWFRNPMMTAPVLEWSTLLDMTSVLSFFSVSCVCMLSCLCFFVVDDGESAVYPASSKSWIIAVEISNNELSNPDEAPWEKDPLPDGPQACCGNILLAIQRDHMDCFRGYQFMAHSAYVLGFAAFHNRLAMLQNMVARGDTMDERVTRCKFKKKVLPCIIANECDHAGKRLLLPGIEPGPLPRGLRMFCHYTTGAYVYFLC